MYLSHLKPVKNSHIFKLQVDLAPYIGKKRHAKPPRPKAAKYQMLYKWDDMKIGEVTEFQKYPFSILGNRMGSVKKSIRNWKYRSGSQCEFKITRRIEEHTAFVVVRRIA